MFLWLWREGGYWHIPSISNTPSIEHRTDTFTISDCLNVPSYNANYWLLAFSNKSFQSGRQNYWPTQICRLFIYIQNQAGFNCGSLWGLLEDFLGVFYSSLLSFMGCPENNRKSSGWWTPFNPQHNLSEHPPTLFPNVLVSICISARLCYCPQMCHLSPGWFAPKLDPHFKPQHCVSLGNSQICRQILNLSENFWKLFDRYYEMVAFGSTF